MLNNRLNSWAPLIILAKLSIYQLITEENYGVERGKEKNAAKILYAESHLRTCGRRTLPT